MIYEVVYRGQGTKIVEEVSERELAYAAGCPVTVATESDSDGGKSAVEGTVLLCEPSPSDPKETIYTVMFSAGEERSRFERGIESSRVKYRKDGTEKAPEAVDATPAVKPTVKKGPSQKVADGPSPQKDPVPVSAAADAVPASITCDSLSGERKRAAEETPVPSASGRPDVVSPLSATPKKRTRSELPSQGPGAGVTPSCDGMASARSSGLRDDKGSTDVNASKRSAANSSGRGDPRSAVDTNAGRGQGGATVNTNASRGQSSIGSSRGGYDREAMSAMNAGYGKDTLGARVRGDIDTRMLIKIPAWLQRNGHVQKDLFFHLIGRKDHDRRRVRTVNSIGWETDTRIHVCLNPNQCHPEDVPSDLITLEVTANSRSSGPRDLDRARENIQEHLLDYLGQIGDQGSKARLIYEVASSCEGIHRPRDSASDAVRVRESMGEGFMSMVGIPFKRSKEGRRYYCGRHILQKHVLGHISSLGCQARVCGDAFKYPLKCSDPHVLLRGRNWQDVDRAAEVVREANAKHMSKCSCAFM
ncbi:hypothetical protein ACHAWF_014323 [Thalassiosira exigua]